MTDSRFREMTDFLQGLGTDDIGHTGSKGFLAHLVSVFRDLERWGGDQDLCRAGMFHSIYGTEKFRRFCLPLDRRDDVRDLIGERAEWLSFLNCFMERTSWDAIFIEGSEARDVRNRETDECYRLSEQDFEALATLQVCDWLEQVPRSAEWDYRRDGYRAMAIHLGGIALEEYDRVFALETAG
jgi:hypothetical protein